MTLFVSRALQVADFGLSKSLVPVGKHDQIMDLNTTYKLTGETGSYRWVVMSVAHRKVGFRQGQSPPSQCARRSMRTAQDSGWWRGGRPGQRFHSLPSLCPFVSGRVNGHHGVQIVHTHSHSCMYSTQHGVKQAGQCCCGVLSFS